MSGCFRVLITDHPWPDLAVERDVLSEVGAKVVEPADRSPEAMAAVAPTVDAIGVCWAPLTAAVLESSRRCRIVARFGVGLDNIPVAAATRLGVPVTYVPDYCVPEVADHTLALILALLRDVPAYDRSLKAGVYDPNRFVPRRLSELTLGVVGFGRIGRAVAKRAEAFGMRVLITSRSVPAGERSLPLADLLPEADILTLHVPLSPETDRLVGKRQLDGMKSGAYFVNTSRGGLVDSQALVDALDSGRLAGAALDVFDPEPPAADDPLVRHPRVIATPHVAFRSAEAVTELRTRAARQISDVLAGRRPEHVVNPAVYGEAGRVIP